MFTGIIEEIGRIKAIKHGVKSAELTIAAQHVLERTRLGDSIATNGVCLTVTQLSTHQFNVDVMNETLKQTNLASLRVGDFVNLERALTLQSRLGGHLLSGHIDGIGVIVKQVTDGIAQRITIETSAPLTRLMIDKGSIAIDGISLTLIDVGARQFTVSLIPHTGAQTTLLNKRIGDSVNLECDMIGKYVEKLLRPHVKTGVDLETLKKSGFM